MIGPKSQHIDYSRLCGLFEEALRAYRVKRGKRKEGVQIYNSQRLSKSADREKEIKEIESGAR